MRLVEGKNVYSVTEVNAVARKNLEQISFWVEGELSSFKGYDRRYRYLYFDLKDPKTSYKLPCIFDPEIYNSLNYQFEAGMKVLALGTLSLWEKEGRYQMQVFKMQEFGEGFLLAELERLKRKLEIKGYFDKNNKKQLPTYPLKLAVIASEVSDAWHDFKKHSLGVFPSLNVTLFDVMVQGEKSSHQIIKALQKADKMNFDSIVIVRGGGSLEDLASFNDEDLATAIFKAKTPIIVGIGHEKDITIASLVADVSASTPTDAAKILTENHSKLEQKLGELKFRIARSLRNLIDTKSQLLDFIYEKLLTSKKNYIALPQKLIFLKKSLIAASYNLISENAVNLKLLRSSLTRDWQNIYYFYKTTLENYHHQLLLVSPVNTLKRGYSITTNARGEIINNVALVDIDEKLKVKLARGKFLARVLDKLTDGKES